jgi:hypothetical protein
MAYPRDTALSAHLAHKKVGCFPEIDALFVNAPDELGVGEEYDAVPLASSAGWKAGAPTECGLHAVTCIWS